MTQQDQHEAMLGGFVKHCARFGIFANVSATLLAEDDVGRGAFGACGFGRHGVVIVLTVCANVHCATGLPSCLKSHVTEIRIQAPVLRINFNGGLAIPSRSGISVIAS